MKVVVYTAPDALKNNCGVQVSTAGQKGWEVGSVEDGFTPIDQVRDRWVSCHFNSSKSGLSQGNGRELYDELNRFILEKRFRTN